jgi:hypothetical protein
MLNTLYKDGGVRVTKLGLEVVGVKLFNPKIILGKNYTKGVYMTRMYGVVKKNKLSDIEEFGAELDVIVADDKLELLDSVKDKLDNIRKDESFVVSYVADLEDAIDVICATSV